MPNCICGPLFIISQYLNDPNKARAYQRMKNIPAYNLYFHDNINPDIKTPRRKGNIIPGMLSKSIDS